MQGFFLSGNIYAAKGGNDSSYPTTAAQAVDSATLDAQAMQCVDKSKANFVPKATVSAGITVCPAYGTVVVGTGVYKETVSCVDKIILCEPSVVFEGNGSNVFFHNIKQGNPGSLGISDCIIRGYQTVRLGGSNITNTLRRVVFDGVQFQPFNDVGGVGRLAFDTCDFINVTQVAPTTNFGNYATHTYLSCNILNSFLYWIIGMADCDVNVASTISFIETPGPTFNFNFNNIRGTVVMATNGDEPGGYQNANPSTAGVGLNFADHVLRYRDSTGRIAANKFNVKSFSSDPKRNGLSRKDLTYKADSPNLLTGSLGTNNIGGKPVTRGMYVSDLVDTTGQPNPWRPENGALITNLSGMNDLTISAGSMGSILSAPIFHGTTPKTLGRIGYVGARFYNKSFAGGTVDNNNVPDATVYAGNDASGGGRPDRLVFRMRYSTQETMPPYVGDARRPDPAAELTDSELAQWDNGGMRQAGVFGDYEFEAVPRIDGAGVCSGEPGFNVNTAGDIGATWSQRLVVLTNNNGA